MRQHGLGRVILAGVAAAVALGAAPAAPTYHAIEATITRIRGEWAKPDARPQPNAPGWNALFDAAVADLRAYASAISERDRLEALNRLYRISTALASVAWPPAT